LRSGTDANEQAPNGRAGLWGGADKPKMPWTRPAPGHMVWRMRPWLEGLGHYRSLPTMNGGNRSPRWSRMSDG